MSFVVTAGGVATVGPANSGKNPTPKSTNGTPPVAPADSGAGKQRRGTDPSKYKTTICRNWEAHGTCSFRGCTFAHGEDELRNSKASPKTPATPPVRTPPLAPAMPPQNGAAPGHQPPLPRSQQVVPKEPSSRPKAPKNGGSTSQASTPLTQAAPPPPPYAVATARTRFSISADAEAGSPPPLYLSTEQLVENLYVEVSHAREMGGVLSEASATLDSMLGSERVLRRDTADRLQALKVEAQRLRAKLMARRAEMQASGEPLPELPTLAANPPLTVSARPFEPASVTSPSATSNAVTPNLQPVSLARGTPPVPIMKSTFEGSPLNLEGPSQFNAAPGGDSSATTTELASPPTQASPTDPGQKDRLKALLQSLLEHDA